MTNDECRLIEALNEKNDEVLLEELNSYHLTVSEADFVYCLYLASKSYIYILKANLSWTLKKLSFSDAKNFWTGFISFFFGFKARLQVWVLSD